MLNAHQKHGHLKEWGLNYASLFQESSCLDAYSGKQYKYLLIVKLYSRSEIFSY